MSAARLVFLSGPLQGQLFPIESGEISVGRDPGNTIVLNHASVSRIHGRLQQTDKGIVLSDQDSKNGTFVNGFSISSTLLKHGSEIRVGNTRILYLDRTDPTPADILEDDPVVGQSTIVLAEADLRYAQDVAVRDNAVAERFAQLLALAKNLSRILHIKELPDALFPAITASLSCRRAGLVLGGHPSDIHTGWFWIRDTGFVPAFRISRTVLEQAMRERKFLLHMQILPGSAPSLVREGVQSVICVPLLSRDQVLGALYMDSSEDRNGLADEDLQFAAAAAGIAALAVDNITRLDQLREENTNLKQSSAYAGGMIGDSESMRPVYDFIRKVGGVDSTVLILGESGTGKELVARAIHDSGSRAAGPFIAVNCAALTESLLESELFGHEKGAFTGAVQQHRGKFERAEGGTLFLDEVFELSATIQAKLLRVLQEREFERVGGTRAIRVDVRVIAATHRDLKEESRKGSFREDLFYRLNVLSVRVPSLRDRSEDIPLLAAHFLARSCEKMHRPSPQLSPETRACLLRYSWPGNVRELENAIERAVVLSASGSINPEDLPDSIFETAPAAGLKLSGYHEAVAETKARVILDAIHAASGNLTEAAKRLGINANYLHRLIGNLGLRPRMQKEK